MAQRHRGRCGGVLLMALLTLPSEAGFAHGNMPVGLLPYVEAGELTAAFTSLGVVRNTGDGFVWRGDFKIPVEVYTLGFTAGGMPLVGTEDGLRVSDDGGCGWESPSELLEGEVVQAQVSAPASDATFLVGTGNREGQSALYRTSDGGRAWAEVEGTQVAGRYTALYYYRDLGRYLALRRHRGEGSWELLSASEDAESWSPHAVLLPEGEEVRLLGGVKGKSAALIAVWEEDAEGDGRDVLYEVGLLEGAAASAVASLEGPVRFVNAVGEATSGAWVTDTLDRLYRLTGEGLEPVGEELRHCLLPVGDGELMACGEKPQTHVFFRSAEGESWEGLLRFDEISVDACPREAGGGESLPGETPTSTKSVDGGWCSGLGPASGWGWLPGVFLWSRRRRRRGR